jgi:hypothetical protein
VQVDIAGDSAHFGAESSNFVGEHARGRDLDRVVPVVVVVAQCVREVQDRHLRDLRRVLSDIEMSWLDRSLGD